MSLDAPRYLAAIAAAQGDADTAVTFLTDTHTALQELCDNVARSDRMNAAAVDDIVTTMTRLQGMLHSAHDDAMHALTEPRVASPPQAAGP